MAIEEKVGRQVGIATDYHNLGRVEFTRGNLDAAEEYQMTSCLEVDFGGVGLAA